jgi:isoquinoline 1-oxidoreductase subunit beta
MGKWTRRGLLAAGVATSGALIVGVAIRPGHRTPKLAGLVAAPGEHLVNVWVKLSPDNTVTAIIPHSEMGQGVHTSLAAMLADEMDADWSKVAVQQAPAHESYANHTLVRAYLAGNLKVPAFVDDTIDGAFLTIARAMSLQITGGSTSVRLTGQFGMRAAGAATRDMLLNAAAKVWKVPVTELRAENSMIFHDASKRSEPFFAFAAEAAKHMPPENPKLKTPDQYKLMGTSVKRNDIPAKVDGTAKFGIDVKLDGLKHAAVIGPPVLGNTITAMDDTAARTMPGVIRVLNMGDFAAVVADGYWQAQRAADTLNLTWTVSGAETLTHTALYDNFRTAMKTATETGKEKKDLRTGDAAKAVAGAARVVEAEYIAPFLAHATMEPMNATAWVHDGICEIWSGMQNPLGSRDAAAKAIGFKKHDVLMHNAYLGGGFGRRAGTDFTDMAARLALETGVPIKVIFSREQDMQQDFYRPASVSRFKAGLDANGLPVSWENQFAQKAEPVEASHPPYAIANQYVHFVNTAHHMRFGAWRSVDHSQHAFFIESFIDELAHAAASDPYQYRRALLAASPRHIAVLDAAAKAANWGKAALPVGTGQGIALVESFGSIVAQVVQVTVANGKARATDVWCAGDPGFAMNPDGFAAQMESGIIYGLSAAMFGEITLEGGAVVQSNFNDYEVIRMHDAPRIHVEIINSGAAIGGGGEPGTPPVAPALANAVFAATGQRVRQLPLARQLGSVDT